MCVKEESKKNPYYRVLGFLCYINVNLLVLGGSRESSVTEGLSSLSDDGLYSQLLLLGSQHDHTANAVHVFELSDSVHLITIVESTNLATSSGLCDSFRYLNLASNLQLQRDLDELKSAVENLDTAIKKLLEGIKKNRSNIGNDVDMCQKRLQTKWDFLRRKYGDLLRTRDPEAVLQIEANTPVLTETLRELLRLTCFDRNFLKQGLDVLTTVGRLVRQKLNDFNDFLKVKAMKNFTLGSYPFLTGTRNIRKTTVSSNLFSNLLLPIRCRDCARVYRSSLSPSSLLLS